MGDLRYVNLTPELVPQCAELELLSFPHADPEELISAADFAAYNATQRRIDHAYADHVDWTRRCVLNTARVGWFSSDRAIRGYARDIWEVPTD